MKMISLNVGLPREVIWHGRSVTTGIYKEPVAGRVALRKLNLDGDRQADLTVHGGEYKAVYCYPVEHYEYWKKEWPGRELPMGMFGENFTVQGLFENDVHLGDRYGEAVSCQRPGRFLFGGDAGGRSGRGRRDHSDLARCECGAGF